MITEEFITKAKTIFGNLYTYDKCIYINSKTNIIVTCKKHGDFEKRPDHFLNGRGCPLCSTDKCVDKESFIKKAQKVHGNKYDYSKVEYVDSTTKVCIICTEHGEFWITPNSHLNGRGCRLCANKKISQRCNKGAENFINEAKDIHGDKYDYSRVNYVRNSIKVEIICPIHGSFFQTPSHHLNGEGCPKCRYVSNSLNQMLSKEEFIERAKKIHGDKYDYSLVNYKGYEEYVDIICPIHGKFKQSPDSHLHSGGCPKCGATLSKNEDEIVDFIKSILKEDNVVERDRKILKGKEIDILIPSKNIGIEYNGLYWHSTKNNRIDKNYHLLKTVECRKKGINLIQIFEDEYVLHKDIVQEKLRHLLSKSSKPKIMGRKCEIKIIDYKQSQKFLNKYHIQGFAKSTVYIGAFFNDDLIAVMSFLRSRKDKNEWELNRFASDYNFICQGVGGKLFRFFIDLYNPLMVKSFSDRRWCINEDDNLYTKLGFIKEKILEPDYRYYNEKIDKYKRIHKFNFRKQILSKKYGLSIDKTESTMAEELGYSKIWDCGLIKYVWKA